MAKNFKNIYNSGNDASALEQKFFLKEETSRGSLLAPAGTDFFRTLAGGAITFGRPINPSPVRSGRHNLTPIEEKDVTAWNMSTFFMINTALGAASTAEIDPAMRVLYKSLLGTETTPAGPKYAPTDPPDTTFSLFMNGDQFAHQASGCFVESWGGKFPGDGQSMADWAGSGKTMYRLGIGKSTADNNAANTITLAAGDGARFQVGGLVMLIEADGVTRSADTPTGSPRAITVISGDVITVSGAVLADADGSGVGAPIYLCYYEPTSPTAINIPLTGLVGTVSVGSLSAQCVRNVEINITNNHELHNFCWGERGLSGTLFTPGGRLNVEVTLEINMSHDILEFINSLYSFGGIAVSLVNGSATGRRMQIDLAKLIPSIPEIAIPDTGSIPVTFSGIAYETAEDAADEITIEFK